MKAREEICDRMPQSDYFVIMYSPSPSGVSSLHET